jgi:hypothetical protein
LFTFRVQRNGRQVSIVTMSCPSPRTVALPPCLPLDIKDSLKEDVRLFGWGFFDGVGEGFFFDRGWIDWLAACKGTATE